MEAKLKVGDHVIFLDSRRKKHHALITAVWDVFPPDDEGVYHITDKQHPPSLNLVYVAEDTSREDQYGRQIERTTSVVHRSLNQAGGNCWKLPTE